MRVTLFFILAPGPVQVESVMYRINDHSMFQVPQAVSKALEQAAHLTTVPVTRIVVDVEPK